MGEPPISKGFILTSFVSAVLSVVIISVGFWLKQKSSVSCVKDLSKRVIIFGGSSLVVFIIGILAGSRTYSRTRFFLVKLLLFFTLILNCLLVSLVIFIHSFVSADVAIPYSPPSRAFMEYKLVDSSDWFGQKVAKISWNRFKDCVAESSLCNDLTQSYDSAESFFKANLSPLQSGCCKPPTMCGYNFVTPTNWISPTNSSADPDCSNWNNEPYELCYDCSSCKAGFSVMAQKTWATANKFLMGCTVLLILTWVLGLAFVIKSRRNIMAHQQGFT